MKKWLIAASLALAFVFAGPGRPAFALGDMVTLDTAVMVAVSTTPSTPTQILSGIFPTSDVAIMLHWSGSGTYPNSEYLLLSASNVTLSTQVTTGAVRIPAGSRPSDFLYLNNYRGPLYGVVIGTTSAQNVSVLRKK